MLLLPRLPTLKEWAYAGFTFMWIAAVVAHYLAGDGACPCCPSRCSGRWRFVRHAPGESPRFRASGAGVARGRSRFRRSGLYGASGCGVQDLGAR